jgi:hypothetical protein
LRLSSEVRHDIQDSEPPPILGTWANINIVVLCWLAFLILLAYGFTRYFS